MVLESFKIMDYSLLLGLHNLERDRDAATDVEAHQEQSVSLFSLPLIACSLV
jgi:hypothetical protein